LFAGTEPGSKGDAGNLTIETSSLIVQDGAEAQATTLGEGDAGNLIVKASQSVELIGKTPDGLFSSRLLAGAGLEGFWKEAQGQGGDLRIETGQLIVRDGAGVTVSSTSTASDAKGAGSLQIQARTIRLDNQATITAETASGQGGDINLQAQELLLLRRNSNISSTAGTAKAGGDGGNITINNTPFIVAVPGENSDITANAFEGSGGLIQIKATQVFGLERREQLTPLSDITAFSEQNPELNGVVEINTADVDPSGGLVTLPAKLVDASELIASGCGAPSRQSPSEFIVTGRGGLPSNPSDTLSSDTVWSDLRPHTQQAQNRTSSESATQQTLPTAPQLVEAQGWVINNKGEVVLTASAPTVTPYSPGLTATACHGS
jgi:large exoprotein involved in heme utilization and adhesion